MGHIFESVTVLVHHLITVSYITIPLFNCCIIVPVYHSISCIIEPLYQYILYQCTTVSQYILYQGRGLLGDHQRWSLSCPLYYLLSCVPLFQFFVPQPSPILSVVICPFSSVLNLPFNFNAIVPMDAIDYFALLWFGWNMNLSDCILLCISGIQLLWIWIKRPWLS